jgi:ribosomal protein S18 acetylase RimI-like enzyme
MTELIADNLNLSVKKIAIDEIHLIIDLFDKYRVFYQQKSDLNLAESFLKDRLAGNESVIFVAISFFNDVYQPIGFTQLYPKYSSVRAVKIWILNDLYVDEHYRKMGIGKKLIDEAIAFAKENKSNFVQLETATHNYNAQHLYESIGFVKQTPDTDYIMYRINID